MLTFTYNKNLHYLILSHSICLILFTVIYYYFFSDIDKHYVLNSKISKDEYLKHKLVNSLYLSVNMQTTTGYGDFTFRSPIGRLTASIQLCLALTINLGIIYISYNNNIVKI
jgi:hypothetical protein